jgi:hypothetical protein
MSVDKGDLLLVLWQWKCLKMELVSLYRCLRMRPWSREHHICDEQAINKSYHCIFCIFHNMQAVGPLPQNWIQGRDWDQCWGAAVAETDSRAPSSDHLVEMKENSAHWLETAGQSCTSADDCPCMASAQLGTGSTFIFPRQKLYIGTPWSFHGIQKFL